MKKLYTLEGLNEIFNAKKKSKILLYICSISFVLAAALLIILSSFKYRYIFIPVIAVIGTLLAFLIIFFAINYQHLNRLFREYEAILNKNDETLEVEIVDVSLNPITLADKSKVFEVSTLKDGKGKYYYLSAIFDENEIIKGKCKIVVAFDYIKEFEYEN